MEASGGLGISDPFLPNAAANEKTNKLKKEMNLLKQRLSKTLRMYQTNQQIMQSQIENLKHDGG